MFSCELAVAVSRRLWLRVKEGVRLVVWSGVGDRLDYGCVLVTS